MLGIRLGFTRLAALLLAALLLPAAASAQQAPGAAQGQAAQQGAGTPFRPVAVVNGAAITGFDLAQRMQILMATGAAEANPEAVRAEALERLIEDQLKRAEAERLGVTASPEEIQAGLEELAQANGMAADEMLAVLSAQGISRQAIESIVEADVLWRKVVRARFSRRVEPGEAEIDAEIAQLRARAGTAWRLAEIGLPADGDGRTPEETRALAQRLSRELAEGGDFEAAVRQYSRAPSAEQGGEVGWVTSDGLPPRIAEALTGLDAGEVTAPIEVSGGVSILKVLETREQPAAAIDASNPELRERVRNRLAGQQGARLAEGLLQELRRDALIEIR